LAVDFGDIGSMSYDWPMMTVKWHALSLKRPAHFDELKRKDRWRQHFADADMPFRRSKQ